MTKEMRKRRMKRMTMMGSKLSLAKASTSEEVVTVTYE